MQVQVGQGPWFSRLLIVSSGSRTAYLPSRPYLMVCVLAAVFLSREIFLYLEVLFYVRPRPWIRPPVVRIVPDRALLAFVSASILFFLARAVVY